MKKEFGISIVNSLSNESGLLVELDKNGRWGQTPEIEQATRFECFAAACEVAEKFSAFEGVELGVFQLMEEVGHVD
jgi:hypothetical protein